MNILKWPKKGLAENKKVGFWSKWVSSSYPYTTEWSTVFIQFLPATKPTSFWKTNPGFRV